MVRTHPSSDYKYPDYDRLNRRQKDDLQRQPNRDRRARLARMETKNLKIHSERGIDVTKLPVNSPIPDIIRWRHWERFIEHPAGYDQEVVKDFYASMHPPTFANRKTVTIGRVQVRVTPEIICNYFGVPSHPNLFRTFGLADNPVFQIPYNGEIASSLRRNGSPVWDSKHNRLLKSDLHYELGFLMLFVKTNLKPSTFCTAADPLVADVLYSIQNNMPMDVGMIIWLEIMDTGHNLSRSLPFPCLITELCRNAGVPVTNNLTKPMSPFAARPLSFQHTAGLRLEERRHRHPNPAPGQPEYNSQSEGEYQDSDYDPEQPEDEDQNSDSDNEQDQPEFHQSEYQQPPQPFIQHPMYQQEGFQPLPRYEQPPNPFTEEPPQYISQLFQGMQLGWDTTNARLDVVHNNMQFMNNNLHCLHTNVQYMNQRMDWDGYPRNAEEAMGGQRRRRRRRGNDGASGSGTGHDQQD